MPTAVEYYIKALIQNNPVGGLSRWGSDKLTFGFMTSRPGGYDLANPDGIEDFRKFNSTQIDAVKQILKLYSEIADLKFTNKGFNDGDLYFGTGRFNSPNTSGLAYYPGQDFGIVNLSGDVWLSRKYSENLTPISRSRSFTTLLHEIGHALGLKHPGNYDAGGNSPPPPYLPAAEDNRKYTVMAYDKHPQQGTASPSTPLLYDIAAIQYLYGANYNTRSNDTVYSWDPNLNFIEAIWDGGGIDQIDASKQKQKVVINLNAGAFSSIGPRFDQKTGSNDKQAVDNLAIAYGVTIENAAGGAGDDFIIGNVVANLLKGNDGDDTIQSAKGNDKLYGGDGNDALDGEEGNDTLYGDNGDDLLVGDSGNDNLFGKAGNDALFGNNDNDKLFGADGNDELFGGKGDDQLFGSVGDDVLYGEEGDDYLTGWDGNDKVYGDQGNDKAYGNDGLDKVYGGDGDDKLYGDQGEDKLYGETGKDKIDGGSEDDTILGGADNDVLYGNEGNDYLLGGDGNDVILGGFSIFEAIAGDDRIYGGAGNDDLYGGLGNDILNGGEGSDRLYAGDEGDDKLYGGAGNDKLWVFSDGTNLLKGGDGNDKLTGQEGIDTLEGEAGNDYILGGDNDDILTGGDGNDFLVGEAGNDSLTGGLGSDSFAFSSTGPFESGEMGIDTITDFEAVGFVFVDRIVLSKTTFAAIDSVEGNGFSVAGDFTVVTTDEETVTQRAAIIYNSSNGKLFYNSDGGTIGLGTGGQFATVADAPALIAANFEIVV